MLENDSFGYYGHLPFAHLLHDDCMVLFDHLGWSTPNTIGQIWPVLWAKDPNPIIKMMQKSIEQQIKVIIPCSAIINSPRIPKSL